MSETTTTTTTTTTSSLSVNDNNNNTPNEEEMRASMLRFWLGALGHPVILHLHENTTVMGILCAIDAKQEYLQMSQLSTPLYLYPETLVRCSDVISLEVLPKTTAGKSK
eukprot:TRINITY_DN3440_c0_g1_i2.p1 TRINITY_DN3440_c0_g1~~TRINITY_DN3440_c0_g1_i2.p1  ORF type:complete len:109 (+),score=23.57 TRINITY_DN3440_c0_g1_i2:100-426(+)